MKLSTMVAAAGILLFAATTTASTASAKTVVTVKMKISKAEVDIDRSIVGAAIRAVKGVNGVRFDADGKLPIGQSSIAEVTFDADATHWNTIQNAVRDAGFTADGIVPDAPAVPIKKK